MTLKHYKLFANCILSKGAERALIIDLQKNKYYPIPLSLYGLFSATDHVLSVDENDYNDNDLVIIKEYLSFLIRLELAFTLEEKEWQLFPLLNTNWNFASSISNIVIDVDNIKLDWNEIVSQMESVQCYYLQIRFYRKTEICYLTEIAANFSDSLIHGFEIILPYNAGDKAEIGNFVDSHPKLRSLIFYNAPENKEVYKAENGFSGVYFIRSNINSTLNCGVINASYFSVNIETYTESLAHNTCLNRKLAIDVDGNIKNCPSMKESFGNIRDTTLEESINKPGFKKYWNLTKDQITKCKDCEFRHICTDCRAYTENPNDIYSAPLKCGYNPYTCEWEEWSTNPLKQQAIEYYGMEELVRKKR